MLLALCFQQISLEPCASPRDSTAAFHSTPPPDSRGPKLCDVPIFWLLPLPLCFPLPGDPLSCTQHKPPNRNLRQAPQSHVAETALSSGSRLQAHNSRGHEASESSQKLSGERSSRAGQGGTSPSTHGDTLFECWKQLVQLQSSPRTSHTKTKRGHSA